MTAAWAARMRRDDGSLPFAMLFVSIGVILSVSLTSLTLWQIRNVTLSDNVRAARWVSDTAVALGIERLNVTGEHISGPAAAGIATAEVANSTPPPGLGWQSWKATVGGITGATPTQLRWWIVPGPPNAPVAEITLYAAGRAGSIGAAEVLADVTLTYDRGTATWKPIAVTRTLGSG